MWASRGVTNISVICEVMCIRENVQLAGPYYSTETSPSCTSIESRTGPFEHRTWPVHQYGRLVRRAAVAVGLTSPSGSRSGRFTMQPCSRSGYPHLTAACRRQSKILCQPTRYHATCEPLIAQPHSVAGKHIWPYYGQRTRPQPFGLVNANTSPNPHVAIYMMDAHNKYHNDLRPGI